MTTTPPDAAKTATPIASMRKQMARDMYEIADKRWHGPSWENLADSLRDLYWCRADVALKALMSPTEAMLNAAFPSIAGVDENQRTNQLALALLAWQDMIRAAQEGK